MVTSDPDEAMAAVAGGAPAVLILPPAAPPPDLSIVGPAQPAVSILRPATPAAAAPAGSARRDLAVLVGDPSDPAVRAAAAEMDRELHPPA